MSNLSPTTHGVVEFHVRKIPGVNAPVTGSSVVTGLFVVTGGSVVDSSQPLTVLGELQPAVREGAIMTKFNCTHIPQLGLQKSV